MEAVFIVFLIRRCDYVPVHLYGCLVSTLPYGRADAHNLFGCTYSAGHYSIDSL